MQASGHTEGHYQTIDCFIFLLPTLDALKLQSTEQRAPTALTHNVNCCKNVLKAAHTQKCLNAKTNHTCSTQLKALDKMQSGAMGLGVGTKGLGVFASSRFVNAT